MSIFSKVWKAVTGSKVVEAVIEFTETQKAVAALRDTQIWKTVAGDISALASSTMTGAEKRAAVVKNTKPLLVDLLADGGLKKAEAEVTDVAEELVQAVYNAVLSKKAETIGSLILKVLGLK